eukprot:g1324.t1
MCYIRALTRIIADHQKLHVYNTCTAQDVQESLWRRSPDPNTTNVRVSPALSSNLLGFATTGKWFLSPIRRCHVLYKFLRRAEVDPRFHPASVTSTSSFKDSRCAIPSFINIPSAGRLKRCATDFAVERWLRFACTQLRGDAKPNRYLMVPNS